MRRKSWYKQKSYTHFTSKLTNENIGFVNSYVSNADNITSHRFYPLIHRVIIEKKYKLVDATHNIRRHYTILSGVKKTTAKFRDIYYANHLDAHIYSYYTQKILSPLYEKQLENNPELSNSILAYRRMQIPDSNRCKCNIDFANDVFNTISALNGDYTIYAFDVTKFFDSLNHKLLKQKWARLLGRIDLPEDHYKVYKSLVNFSYVELYDVLKELNINHPNNIIQDNIRSFYATGVEFRNSIVSKGLVKKNPFKENETQKAIGIPQGTPISAFLANLYMLDYDIEMHNLISSNNGIYRRYSDDILVICPTEKAETIKKSILESITKYKLVIQDSKTQITRFTNGRLMKGYQPVKYLGFEFNGKTKRIKSSSISKYYRNLKRSIKYKANRARIMKRKRPELSFIYRKQIYKNYSHLSITKSNNRKRNYLSYINLATDVMNEPKIKRQLSKSWKIIHSEIDRYTRKYNLTEEK